MPQVKTASAGEAFAWQQFSPRDPPKLEMTGSLPAARGLREERDRVPPEVALAYAAQPDPSVRNVLARAEPMGSFFNRPPVRAGAEGPAQDSSSVILARKTLERLPAGPEPAPVSTQRLRADAPIAPGMSFDDPWLRAMILASNLQTCMTVALWGTPDYEHMSSLIQKPAATVLMTFASEAYPGMTDERFTGGAIVFLSTVTFAHRTAALQ
jgi:hypothetical protein